MNNKDLACSGLNSRIKEELQSFVFCFNYSFHERIKSTSFDPCYRPPQFRFLMENLEMMIELLNKFNSFEMDQLHGFIFKWFSFP